MASEESPQEAAEDQQQPVRFDEALARLEQLVERLEQGDLSLEESLEQFEQGVTLARQCREALTAAEQKVRVLSSDEQGDTLEAFDPDAG